MRWSYVLVIVTTLDMPIVARFCGSAPWNSAGKSMLPTPTMTPWPGISRGTLCTVPIVPGLVSVTLAPWKSSTVSLFALTLRMSSS